MVEMNVGRSEPSVGQVFWRKMLLFEVIRQTGAGGESFLRSLIHGDGVLEIEFDTEGRLLAVVSSGI